MYKQVILYDNTGTLLVKNTAQYKVQKYKKIAQSKKRKTCTAQHELAKTTLVKG